MKSTDIDVLIVTGAGRGIGREIALEFGRKDTKVLCISRTRNSTKVAKRINEGGGSAESLVLDLKNYDKTQKIISKWIKNKEYKRYGIVLAAAILGPEGPLSKCALDEWDSCHKINILGNLAIIKSVLPVMLKNKFGRIITFAGGGSAYPFPKFPAYSATKTAVVRITENINEDLKDKGDFIVVCLAPGAVETNMLRNVKRAGVKVKTIVDISKPVEFVREVIRSKRCTFSGAFVHVNNNWKKYLNSKKKLKNYSYWKLRRIE